MTTFTFRSGPIDRTQQHFELRYGSVDNGGWDDWIPVALVARGEPDSFLVETLLDSRAGHNREALEAVQRELDFYLVEKGEPDPWAYACYHCGTSANVYSSVHWSLVESHTMADRDKLEPTLVVSRRACDSHQIEEWKKGGTHREKILEGIESKHLRNILELKAATRSKTTTRFFGEAFVASTTPHVEGYYGSFKWLKNQRFASTAPFPRGRSHVFQRALREALHRHFSRERIAALQAATRELNRTCKRELGGVYPTAPDLWLMDESGHHRFIEVKLPGDSIAPHQLAGLALITSCLGGVRPVSTEIVELNPGDDELFKVFCRSIVAG
ncbi:MAG: VRR-NUC domain-containing protein [Vicinamibacterales bacterium]